MQYTLSKRERRLLYILLCVILVVAGWVFVVEPAFSTNRSARTKVVDAQMELNTAKNTYNDYSNAALNADEELNKYAVQTQLIYAMMNNESIDQLVTGIALLNGLQPENLLIDDVSSDEILAYNPADDGDAVGAETAPTTSVVKSVKVSLSVKGSLESIKQVCDAVQANLGLYLKDFNYVSAQGEEVPAASINFILYMMEK